MFPASSLRVIAVAVSPSSFGALSELFCNNAGPFLIVVARAVVRLLKSTQRAAVHLRHEHEQEACRGTNDSLYS